MMNIMVYVDVVVVDDDDDDDDDESQIMDHDDNDFDDSWWLWVKIDMLHIWFGYPAALEYDPGEQHMIMVST